MNLTGIDARDLRHMLLDSWSRRTQSQQRIVDGLAEIHRDNTELFDDVAGKLRGRVGVQIAEPHGMEQVSS